MRRSAQGWVAVVALACAIAALPAGASASPRVVGGSTVTGTDPSPYPFMAALVFAGEPNAYLGQYCGGSLIAPDRVLTAGHCVLGASPSDFDVVVGRKRLTEGGGQRLAVRGISVDPAVDPETGTHDVALVLLASSAPGADTPIQPVSASPSSDDALWTPGTNLTVAGWGATDRDGSVYPDDLQQGTVTRKTDATCQSDYGDDFVAADEVCAQGPTTDACYGDSGGPLFTQGASPLQVGVVNFGGDTCLDPNHPGVYARLAASSIRSFVTSANPVLQPYTTSNPSISSDQPVVGSAVTCTGAQFGGGPVTSERTLWGREGDLDITLVGEGVSYTPTNDDLGSPLVCAVVARNAGGIAVAQSESTSSVIGPPPGQPGIPPSPPPPIGSPPPLVVTPPTDATAPRAVLVDRGCKHRRCTVNVAVTDTPPSSGALGVTGRLTGATRCKRHHVCKRPRPKTLIGKRTAAERFTIATGRLKPGRYALALRASDAAGNVQAIATTVRLSVR